jgi:Zn-dependent peptidase ImmA (M78 family)
LTIDPYALLAGMPHLNLEVTRLPDDEMGRWIPERQMIVLDDRLDQAERRCTLVHEMVHHISGDHTDLTPELSRMQERMCRERTARLLITLPSLADAMLWSEHAVEIAEQLWVDEPTLWDRLEHLTAEEHRYLRMRLARKEGVA